MHLGSIHCGFLQMVQWLDYVFSSMHQADRQMWKRHGDRCARENYILYKLKLPSKTVPLEYFFSADCLFLNQI